MPSHSTRASLTAKASSAGDRRVKFVASTRDVDRHGTRLLPRGCKYDNFLKNPVVLWNHSKDSPDPDDVIGRVVDIAVTDDSVLLTVEFEGPENTKADRCLQKVRKDYLRAVSVGFIPLREQPPDKSGVIDVVEWELAELSLCPVGSNPNALAQRSFTVRAAHTFETTKGRCAPTPSRGYMEPKAILEKLGIAEGAKPEEIAAALIKYLAGGDSEADKVAVVTALLGMLAPAAESGKSDGAAETSMDAAADEIRRLNARVAELEEAAKKPSETPEERADKACRAGQWPMAKRDALVEQYKLGKAPFLFPAKTFSTRGVQYTAGGNPAQADAKPNIVDAGAKPELSPIEKQILANAQRAGLSLTPESFAAAKARANKASN